MSLLVHQKAPPWSDYQKYTSGADLCCEKFKDYLLGLPNFLIETDHKPLLALMKTKPLDELTPRIQRFRMRMMRFSYDVEHVAGKNLATADTLSRAPGSKPEQEDREREEETHAYVRAVVDSIPQGCRLGRPFGDLPIFF